jgi:hypothetical protein
MDEAAQGLEDGHDAWIPKPEHALPPSDRRLLETVQCVLHEDTVMTDALELPGAGPIRTGSFRRSYVQRDLRNKENGPCRRF